MKTDRGRNLRWLAFPFAVIFLVLAVTGFVLQGITGTEFNQTSLSILIPFYLIMALWLVIGVLLIWFHPHNPVGWLIAALMPLVALDQAAVGYIGHYVANGSASLPVVDAVLLWIKWTAMPFGIIVFTLGLLLVPNGRVLSRRWRLVVWAAVAVLLMYLLLKALEPTPTIIYPGEMSPLAVDARTWSYLSPLLWLAISLMTLCLCAALYSLIQRLKQSKSEERQQIKWLVLPPVLFIVGIPVVIFGQYEASGNLFLLGGFIHMIAVSAFVFALAVAVFKYRLYDIDIIINRALVYSLLTLLLTAIFFGTVVLMERAVRFFAGQDSPLVIVASTLLIAALFSPLRQRIQDLIDRRFYRKKYDAVQTLAGFSETARDEVNLESLISELIIVVDNTMKPDTVIVWLRTPGDGQVQLFGPSSLDQ